MADELATTTGDDEVDTDRAAVAKMHVISYDDAPPSNVREEEDRRIAGMFGDAGALLPPYPPELLGRMVEESNILPQCIHSYVTNCDGFGHRFTPIIDLTKEDADKKIADIIYLERLDAMEEAAGADTQPDPPEPTEAEINQRKALVQSEMRKELARLTAFFDYCTDQYSFVELRRRARHDKETNGNGYWEVIRNGLRKIAELRHVPSYTIRLLRKGPWMQVPVAVRVSPITTRTVTKWRRFRRYIQICEGIPAYFKEFGDTRVMSVRTGKFYEAGKDRQACVDAMMAAEPTTMEATELWCDALYNPTGPYGLPRWIGNYLSVQGSHKMEYVNYLFFDNKSIPPLAVMIEGGRLSSQSIKAFKDFIENKVRGARNFHKAIILEAMPAENSTATTADGKVRIKIQPLTDAILKDGLFMEYDERNRNKIGESFRLPKILRGDSSDVNRATADAALSFAEQQVFSGERNAFDYLMDRTILTDLGIRYYQFESLGVDLKNPEALSIAAKQFENALNRNEVRAIAEDVFGRDYKPVEGGDQPFALTLAGAASGGLGVADDIAGAEQARQEGNVVAMAKHLVAIRKTMLKAEQDSAAKEFSVHKSASADEEQVIRVPAAELAPFITGE
jgi:PBSX family phage portal protein